MNLNFQVDWGGLPLNQMLRSVVEAESGALDVGQVQEVRRGELKIVWLEHALDDPVEHRRALTRCALALRADILPLITFNFWPEDKPKWEHAWSVIIEALRLAEGSDFKRRN
jgi:hypothetical protein